ncbi:hypothetical protein [Rickettsia endosymbiont of Urophora cardui]|uniref:hypothetical protein n=1 Tax=Rickettsia endosymbiont of Urophora cardui TaxID=3066265 RepID=UPI00313D7D80
MQIEKNKKINAAIDLLIKGGVDLKTVLSQNGLIHCSLILQKSSVIVEIISYI